jgi:hypothetical protein
MQLNLNIEASVTALDSDRWTPMNEGAWLMPIPRLGAERPRCRSVQPATLAPLAARQNGQVA